MHPATQFLFYDLETSGLNPCFDQVLQFAAIWTDPQLNEIKREQIIVRLNPDCLPNPYASITHRISLESLQSGQSEYAAICQIHQWFNQPHTITLGYNTLGFDDEFLRYSFYRNLLDPYSHQYANHCKRMDIFPITTLYYLFKNKNLNWPKIDGKTSLKLEAINKANQLASGRAHDAMVDVEVTVALARQLAKDQKMWAYCLDHFDKNTAQTRALKLQTVSIDHQKSCPTALMIKPSFGFKNNYQSCVISLGAHQHYRNQTLWLRLDNEAFDTIDEDQWLKQPWVINTRLCEQSWPLPMTDHYTRHLSPARIALTKKNIAWLQDNPKAYQRLADHHRNLTWPAIPNLDPQAALYSRPFSTPQQKRAHHEFHLAPAENKYQISCDLLDAAEQNLALRLAGRSFPDQLNNEAMSLFQEYLQHRTTHATTYLDYRGNAQPGIDELLTMIEDIKTKQKDTLDDEQINLLQELEQYFKIMIEKNSRLLPSN